MNLLPIIYSSLMIFTAFVVFVVIISYITYKVKEKNRVSYQPAALDLTATYINKRTQKNIYNQQSQPSYKQKEYIAPVSNQNFEAQQENRRYSEPVTRSRIIHQTVEMPRVSRTNYSVHDDYPVRHRTTNVSTQSRFDVVNDQQFSSNSKRFEEQNVNFLNYYADDEEIFDSHNYAKVS